MEAKRDERKSKTGTRVVIVVSEGGNAAKSESGNSDKVWSENSGVTAVDVVEQKKGAAVVAVLVAVAVAIAVTVVAAAAVVVVAVKEDEGTMQELTVTRKEAGIMPLREGVHTARDTVGSWLGQVVGGIRSSNCWAGSEEEATRKEL